jgi:hypothetical protein
MISIGVLGGVTATRGQQSTFAGNAQHTAHFNAPAQPLNAVHWTIPVDLVNGGSLAHYAAPLITAANTVFASVRTTTGFQLSAYQGTTGRLKYTLTNDYLLPTPPTNGGWIPVYQPVIANPPSGPRLYYAGAGGTIYYVTNVDSDTPGLPIQQCFYTNLSGYNSNAAAFNSTVFINTPLTANSNGVVYFGFRVPQTAPVPLNTTQNGFARIDPNGDALYVLAGAAANDALIYRDSHNCAPALSEDGATLYVAVKGTNAYYAYLLGLDSATLATKYRVFLKDPVSGNNAGVSDDSTASPTIGPDGDVYFGVVGDPNIARGYLLHFSADLLVKKTPGGFGWDYTPVIVPTNIVTGYDGLSPYLLFSKYNNYATFGGGDGINRIALLDPNAKQVDPHGSSQGLSEMREILTVMGGTPDEERYGDQFPYAVREWCINTGAVNPATKSVFAPSEDGRIYRWNVEANSISETLLLGPGIGSPYVPTAIGPDGAVYTIQAKKLFSLGGLTNVSVGIYSSAPDLRDAVMGQSITFTAVVSNLLAAGSVPTGTVTFEDSTYDGLDPVTNVLALNVPLTNGVALVTNSTLSAGGNYLGNHFITAAYSGDGLFPQGRATLLQKIHASSTVTTLISALATNAVDDSVTLAATVIGVPSSSVPPSGMVFFRDGTNFLKQTVLNTNGSCVVTQSGWNGNSHLISASYCSDTMNASSSAAVVGTPAYLQGSIIAGALQLSFSNRIGAPFTVLRSLEFSATNSNWQTAGSAIEIFPGQFQFSDPVSAANGAQRFYRVRSP